jgi:hypothetical protein
MGKVTPSELSELLNDLIGEKLNTEEDSLITENKTIVGAINEIYHIVMQEELHQN